MNVSVPAKTQAVASRSTPVIHPQFFFLSSLLPTSVPRSRHKTLTLEQRILLVTQAQDGVSRAVLADRYGVDRRTVRRVYAQRETHWESSAAGVSPSSQCTRASRFRTVCQELFEWFVRARTGGPPVSRLALQVRASALAQRHYPGVAFNASNGLIERWRTRRGVRGICLHGSGGAVDTDTAAAQVEELREKLVGVDPDPTLNMDEAAVFYQLAPTNSYVLSRDARQTRGTAPQRAKARVTIVVCANATGTFKFVSVIGKSAQPVCFCGHTDNLPIKYYTQANAWMNRHVFQEWKKDILELLRAFTQRPAVLLMDNASGNDFTDVPGLRSERLPPKTTARHQPCDQGVINTRKTTYKTGRMRQLLEVFDKRLDETAAEAAVRGAYEAAARPGSLGLADCRTPHVLDAKRLVKEALDGLSQAFITRCWMPDRCLPLDVAGVLSDRLAVATDAADPAAGAVASAIVQQLSAARSLGIGHRVGAGEVNGVGSVDELLIAGESPNAIPVIERWREEQE